MALPDPSFTVGKIGQAATFRRLASVRSGAAPEIAHASVAMAGREVFLQIEAELVLSLSLERIVAYWAYQLHADQTNVLEPVT